MGNFGILPHAEKHWVLAEIIVDRDGVAWGIMLRKL
jgi:hypothetical protein